MMPTTGTLTLATKSMTLSLLSGTTLIIGGGLAWVLWKQRQRIQQNEGIQSDLSQQLNEIKSELDTLKRYQQSQKELEQKKRQKEKEQEQEALSKTKFSFFQGKDKADKDTSRSGLFKQLLNENLSFRKSH